MKPSEVTVLSLSALELLLPSLPPLGIGLDVVFVGVGASNVERRGLRFSWLGLLFGVRVATAGVFITSTSLVLGGDADLPFGVAEDRRFMPGRSSSVT